MKPHPRQGALSAVRFSYLPLAYMITVCAFGLPAWAWAQPTPDFVDTAPALPDTPPALSPPPAHTPAILPPSSAVTEKLPEGNMDKADFLRALQSDPAFAERLINGALVQQRWDWLAFLLPIYRAMPQHDATLADFAEGMMLRAQGQLTRAIALYRGIIAAQPDLIHVRMNLAVMLYEDRQFEAAVDQLRKVSAQENLDASVREAAERYLAEIQKQETWRYGFGVNYEYTDNVNHASSERFIMLDGKCWGFGPNMCLRKADDAMPQTANGVRYQADVSRDWNMAGNHYVTAGAGIEGVHYWDAHDYDDFSWRMQAGYAYRNLKQQWSLTPHLAHMRFGGKQYSKSFGLTTEYVHRFSPQWQLMAAGDLTRTEYATHRTFDGNRLSLSLMAAFMPSARTMLFGGADWSHARAQAASNAYRGHGVRVGMVQEWPWGISTRVNLRYGEKYYDAPQPPYNHHRHDKEYQGTLTVWHRALSAWGITPKLNLQYLKIDSNMAFFYSRIAKRMFVSLEKTF